MNLIKITKKSVNPLKMKRLLMTKKILNKKIYAESKKSKTISIIYMRRINTPLNKFLLIHTKKQYSKKYKMISSFIKNCLIIKNNKNLSHQNCNRPS